MFVLLLALGKSSFVVSDYFFMFIYLHLSLDFEVVMQFVGSLCIAFDKLCNVKFVLSVLHIKLLVKLFILELILHSLYIFLRDLSF